MRDKNGWTKPSCAGVAGAALLFVAAATQAALSAEPGGSAGDLVSQDPGASGKINISCVAENGPLTRAPR
jgi:hypothetical protein